MPNKKWKGRWQMVRASLIKPHICRACGKEIPAKTEVYASVKRNNPKQMIVFCNLDCIDDALHRFIK